MKVNSMENPSEKGHHKSYVIVEMQRLRIWNSLISSGTLCYYQLGWKNWNLPPQLSLPLCVSKISTPGIPQLLSHNEELLLWLKGWSVATSSTCDRGWQMACVKFSGEKYVAPPEGTAQMVPLTNATSSERQLVAVSKDLCLGHNTSSFDLSIKRSLDPWGPSPFLPL